MLAIAILLFLHLDIFANVKENLILANYKNTPSKTYKNQLLNLSFTVITAENNISNLDIKYQNYYGIKLLNKENSNNLKANNLEVSFYAKVTENFFKLPDINISISNEATVIDSFLLKGEKKRANKVYDNSGFCGVVANKIDIINYKVDSYDKTNNIVVLELESDFGNLEDFYLQGDFAQGTDWIENSPPKTKIFYYVLLPISKKEVTFNYFNPIEEEYKKINIKFDFSKYNQKVSTQVEINPTKKSLPYLRFTILITLGIIFLLLYLVKKNYLYLILAIFSLTFLLLSTRDESVFIKKDTTIYLLPTRNSSYFFKTNDKTMTKLLNIKNGYYKILLPDNKIGWVKERDVIKN